MPIIQRTTRRLPIGAEPISDGVHFRIWAPGHDRISIVFQPDHPLPPVDLDREPEGYFSGFSADAAPGMTYWVDLEDGGEQLPDPASRFQPKGPRGPSQIIDAGQFEWHDSEWSGVSAAGQVLYEMHIGTFTRAGNWDAARAELAELAEFGITVVELMPVAEFPGQFGWSYDGANLFAPSHLYGPPDAFRRFVDEAHRLGIGVILDVVYNHLGSVGAQLIAPFAEGYFSRRHKNEWGRAINFDDVDSGPVREFFVTNLRHWIGEYHLDGVRIDATQAFDDDSPRHILLELARAARAAAEHRQILVVGESEPQRAALLQPADRGGCELDALWSDDFHHAAMVRLTGRSEAYFTDYEGSAEEFVAAAKWGFLYQGQRYSWQKRARGTPALDVRPERFVHYLQNHDQVANAPRGLRIHELTSPGRLRAMTALWLLMPQTPLLLQGQEFAASTPFLYFNDCSPDAAAAVAAGRAKFLSQFRSYALTLIQEILRDPVDRASFESCKLDFSERETHAATYALHRDLLHLRRDLAHHDPTRLAAAALGPDALILRYYPFDMTTRLLVVNFGRDLRRDFIPQPLVAPPAGARWRILWSSEDPRYGGNGTPELDTPDGWRIPGEAAVMLAPVPVASD
ncbi:MAG TPA: alpha-amylase family glycosyl hydrolase [Pirellulales bacterium]|jgi:maltooligosyltrehalose trehalohydrolase|nr:alpha-amylase family glycosyl hydrolase [Pirellulales bacterium]